jgi:hypothetical protein
MSNTTLVRVACPMCRESRTLEVPADGFERWQSGELIQNAMPELSADDREQLISGTCGKCWTELFGSDE